jgi:chaperonin GroEL
MSRLLRSPQSLRDVASGVDQLTRLLGVTLGPHQGVIVSQIGPGRPEQLTDSGVIARRVTELPDQGEDVGAMLLRGMAQQMRDQYRDGVATAAVLAGAMMRAAVKLIAAGHNPMLIRRGMTQGAAAAKQALAQQSQLPAGQKQLEQVAMTAIHDAELSAVLGEMFDLLGPYGAYIVEEYAAPRIDREYIDGGRWRMRPASRLLMPAGGGDLTLHNPVIAIFHDKVERIAQIRPALEFAMQRKSPLLLVAQDIGGEAQETLILNYAQGKLDIGVAVTTVTMNQRQDDLDDLALLVGAQPLSQITGRLPERLRPEWLGQARQITLGRDALTIIGGTGPKPAMQQRVAELQERLRRLNRIDDDWKRLKLRVARLSGGLCILKVGAYTFKDREQQKELAEKAMRVLELAVTDGIVPGGGVAYLGCIPAVLAAAQQRADPDERHGMEVIAAALEAPFLRIVANDGRIHPPIALHEARAAGAGFDVRSGQCVDMLTAGIIDSRAVLAGALDSALSAATMALTTEVLILHER